MTKTWWFLRYFRLWGAEEERRNPGEICLFQCQQMRHRASLCDALAPSQQQLLSAWRRTPQQQLLAQSHQRFLTPLSPEPPVLGSAPPLHCRTISSRVLRLNLQHQLLVLPPQRQTNHWTRLNLCPALALIQQHSRNWLRIVPLPLTDLTTSPLPIPSRNLWNVPTQLPKLLPQIQPPQQRQLLWRLINLTWHLKSMVLLLPMMALHFLQTQFRRSPRPSPTVLHSRPRTQEPNQVNVQYIKYVLETF